MISTITFRKWYLLLLAGLFVACGNDDEAPAPLPNYAEVIQGTYQVQCSYEVLLPDSTRGLLIDTVEVVVDRVNDEQVRFEQSNGLRFQATFVQQASDGAIFTIIDGSDYRGLPLVPDTNDEEVEARHGIFFYPTEENATDLQQIVYRIRYQGRNYDCDSFDYQP